MYNRCLISTSNTLGRRFNGETRTGSAWRVGTADIATGRFKFFETKASLRDHRRSVANKATVTV